MKKLKHMMGILPTFEILRFAQYDNTTVIVKESIRILIIFYLVLNFSGYCLCQPVPR